MFSTKNISGGKIYGKCSYRAPGRPCLQAPVQTCQWAEAASEIGLLAGTPADFHWSLIVMITGSSCVQIAKLDQLWMVSFLHDACLFRKVDGCMVPCFEHLDGHWYVIPDTPENGPLPNPSTRLMKSPVNLPHVLDLKARGRFEVPPAENKVSRGWCYQSVPWVCWRWLTLVQLAYPVVVDVVSILGREWVINYPACCHFHGSGMWPFCGLYVCA